MILVVEQHNAAEHADLLEQMFRLRARVFKDKLKWDIPVVDGLERDVYDDYAPVYILYTDERKRKLKGSLRLMPTTGPTLLSDVFADTIPDAAQLSAPAIWECTRFCLDEELLCGAYREELLVASGVLLAAAGEVGLRSGIDSFVANFDAARLRAFRRVGCEIEVLGFTRRYGRPIYLGLLPVTEPIVNAIKSRLTRARSLAVGAEQPLAA